MHTRQLKTNEAALLLAGLRAIYVANEEPARQKLMLALEGELASRGCSLPGSDIRTKEEVNEAS